MGARLILKGRSEKTMSAQMSPGHARETDANGKADVISIILDPNNLVTTGQDLGWSDEEEDPSVDNLVKLIDDVFPFNNSCFRGGVSRVEVIRMREEAKAEALNRKNSRPKSTTQSTPVDLADHELIASVLKEKMRDEFSRLESQILSLREQVNDFKNTVIANSEDMFVRLESLILRNQHTAVPPTAPRGEPHGVPKQPPVAVYTGTQPMADPSDIIDDAMRFVSQAFAADDCVPNPPDHIHSTSLYDMDPPADVEAVHCPTSPQCNDVQASFTGNGHDHPKTPNAEPQADLCPDHSSSFPNPTFSLGLTQEERLSSKHAEPTPSEGPEPNAGDVANEVDDNIPVCRKSKRQKVLPRSLVGEYECDKRLLYRAREALVDPHQSGTTIDYPAKFSSLLEKMQTSFSIKIGSETVSSSDIHQLVERSRPISSKVVDVLMHHICSLFLRSEPTTKPPSAVFLDTQFVALLSRNFSKFSKAPKKDSYRFPQNLVVSLLNKPPLVDADRFYFPFNFDKQHWVGICVDTTAWTVTVLDCNIGLRSDFTMAKELKPIALMFPYLLKQAGKTTPHKESKFMSIERPRAVPQITCQTASGVSSVLLIQAHAVAGVEVCKCITTQALDSEIERLAVMLYESSGDTL